MLASRISEPLVIPEFGQACCVNNENHPLAGPHTGFYPHDFSVPGHAHNSLTLTWPSVEESGGKHLNNAVYVMFHNHIDTVYLQACVINNENHHMAIPWHGLTQRFFVLLRRITHRGWKRERTLHEKDSVSRFCAGTSNGKESHKIKNIVCGHVFRYLSR